MSEDNFNKNKEEQLKDFDIIKKFADKNCQLCWSRGYQGWSEEHKRFIPCICIIKNLEKIGEQEHRENAEEGGLLSKIRQSFGLN